jgi:hypothetical protein
VFVASATEPLDTSNALGLAIVRMLVTFGNLESATISTRLAARFEQRAREGLPHRSNRPYGLTRDWRDIVPEEAAMIREAVERVLAGDSVRSIAMDWNRRGVPTVRGGPWAAGTLARILASHRLAGERFYKGEVVARGQWPVILEPDVAAEVRLRVADPSRRGRTLHRRQMLLFHLLRCGRCGSAMVGSNAYRRQRNKAAYRCPEAPYGCGSISINAPDTDIVIVTALLDHVDDMVLPTSAPTRRLRRIILDEHTDRLRRAAHDHYVTRQLARAEYLAVRRALDRDLTVDRHFLDGPPPELTALKAASRDARDQLWERLDLEARRAIVAHCAAAITVQPRRRLGGVFDPDRIVIEWVAPDAVDPASR